MQPPRLLVRIAVTAFQQLRRAIWFVARPQVRGVLAVPLTPEGKVVLVRLTYARGWHLPGGGIKKGETPEAASAGRASGSFAIMPKRACPPISTCSTIATRPCASATCARSTQASSPMSSAMSGPMPSFRPTGRARSALPASLSLPR
jgi:hypothetical protein